jgi:16S rRNA (cytidine1402-2'-O)-methyltransferase
MLTLVPTPIGNLEDISPRALAVLKNAAAIYCEDTRRTRKLTSRYSIGAPLLRYRDRDPRGVERILARLRAQEEIVLVSDSGLPVISDPGLDLVAAAREEGLPVSVLPGPCAAATAVAGSGLPGDSFVFLGFLPRAPGKQRKALRAAAALERSIVIYESPYRVRKLLSLAEETLGPSTQAAVCRELSKLHEEWLTGTVASVAQTLAARKEILGEFVVILHPTEAADV